jgi:hypothetical protein
VAIKTWSIINLLSGWSLLKVLIKAKTLRVIIYLMSDQIIDTEFFENISLVECVSSKAAALEDINPVTDLPLSYSSRKY